MLFQVVLCALFVFGSAAPSTDGWQPLMVKYPVHVVLDNENRVTIYWMLEPDSKSILMEVHAKIQGWFGIGFSPNGGMANSDVIIGWIDGSGVPHLTDRHVGTSAGFPQMDEQQNYELVGGTKNETHIMMSFRRKLDTCDPQDFPIGDDTVRLIYALSDHVPANDNDMQKHEVHNRGTRAVFFMDVSGRDMNTPLDPGTVTMDFMSTNVTVPEDLNSLYWCHIFKLPDLPKHHMIKYEPLVQKGNEPFVHHMVLYTCQMDLSAYVDKEEPCFDPTETHFSAMYQCTQDYFAAWAVGAEAHVYPKDVGFPVFENGGPKFVLLEMHYDNSAYNKNIRDSSGLRIYITPNLRPIEAAIVNFGLPVGPFYQTIPPGQKPFTNYGYCTADCTKDIPSDGMNLFSMFPHMHTIGWQIRLRQIRNGIELPPVVQDNNYDFNYQDIRMKRTPVKMMPNDVFILECNLDSTKRTETTYGGFSTKNEMCLAIIEYYPRMPNSLRGCFSMYDVSPAYGLLGAKGENFTTHSIITENGQQVPVQEWIHDNVNWGANDLVRKFQDIVRDGTHYVMCSNNSKSDDLLVDKQGKPVQKVVVERLNKFDVVHLEENPKLTKGSAQYVAGYYVQKGMPTVTKPYVPPNQCSAADKAKIYSTGVFMSMLAALLAKFL